METCVQGGMNSRSRFETLRVIFCADEPIKVSLAIKNAIFLSTYRYIAGKHTVTRLLQVDTAYKNAVRK